MRPTKVTGGQTLLQIRRRLGMHRATHSPREYGRAKLLLVLLIFCFTFLQHNAALAQDQRVVPSADAPLSKASDNSLRPGPGSSENDIEKLKVVVAGHQQRIEHLER